MCEGKCCAGVTRERKEIYGKKNSNTYTVYYAHTDTYTYATGKVLVYNCSNVTRFCIYIYIWMCICVYISILVMM